MQVRVGWGKGAVDTGGWVGGWVGMEDTITEEAWARFYKIKQLPVICCICVEHD